MAKAIAEPKPRRVDGDARVAELMATLHKINSQLGVCESELHAKQVGNIEDVLQAVKNNLPVESGAPDRNVLRQRVALLQQAQQKTAADITVARMSAAHRILDEHTREFSEADTAISDALHGLAVAISERRQLWDGLVVRGVDWQWVKRRFKSLAHLQENMIAMEAAEWASRR
jgi:hypothetical protein